MQPITGPIERIDGKLCLMIPLDLGGRELIPYTRGIGHVEGEFLRVELFEGILQFLNIREGSPVTVDIVDGKFNVRSSNWKPGDPPPTVRMPPA